MAHHSTGDNHTGEQLEGSQDGVGPDQAKGCVEHVWKRERGTQMAEKRVEEEEATAEDPGKRAGRRRGGDLTRGYVQPQNWAELYRRR